MLRPASDYDALRAGFRWEIPDRYNMGVAVCDGFGAAEPDRPAILEVSPEGGVMGGTRNTVHLIARDGSVETWPTLDKDEVARRLVERLAGMIAG